MSHAIRRHLTYPNVGVTIAIVFSMGGTGYALTIPRNSVGSAQIKKSAVANSDIRSNAVTAAKVRNGSLLAADFAAGQLPKGATGATGATGPGGPQGIQGVQGVAGVVAAITINRAEFALPEGGTGITTFHVPCPAGTTIIGGGSQLQDIGALDIRETASRPTRVSPLTGDPPAAGETFNAWRVAFRHPTVGASVATARAFAICAQT